MKIAILSLLLLLPLAGPALAHNPPFPILTCQITDNDKQYHEYGPAWNGLFIFPLFDGNLTDCPKNQDIHVGVNACAFLSPDLCAIDVGTRSPLLDYDGEIDYGGGGAVLFLDGYEGDGVSSGTIACYGWPSTGHHGTTIYAQDVLGFGPRFEVTADYSRAGFESLPDCGDNLVEPCAPHPPPPSGLFFPANVAVDTLNAVLYTLFGPGGEGCNALDNRFRCASTAVGPSRCTVPFGPGADGALSVFLENDDENGRIPTAGHIWTD